ncbi:hypothetical protein QYF36_003953 [Acer negundo]|nr:hypothetical protein QYF36_003953 [Acer negundo]
MQDKQLLEQLQSGVKALPGNLKTTTARRKLKDDDTTFNKHKVICLVDDSETGWKATRHKLEHSLKSVWLQQKEDKTVHNLNEFIEIRAEDISTNVGAELINDVSNKKFGVVMNKNQLEELFSQVSQ